MEGSLWRPASSAVLSPHDSSHLEASSALGFSHRRCSSANCIHFLQTAGALLSSAQSFPHSSGDLRSFWMHSPHYAGMSRPPQALLRPLGLDFSLRHCNATTRCCVGHGFSLRSTLWGSRPPFCPGIPHTGLTYPPPEEINATDSRNGGLWETRKKNMEEKMAKL